MNTYSVIYLSLYISPESEYFCPLLYMDGTSIELFEPSEESYQRAKQCMFIECKMVGWACEGAYKVCVWEAQESLVDVCDFISYFK